MLILHHYSTESATALDNVPMPKYDGIDFLIPPSHTAVLVPCCNTDDHEHIYPDTRSCLLLTPNGIMSADSDKNKLFVFYMIDNTSNVCLLVKHGDILGANYSGPHREIYAERAYMLTGNYQLLIEENFYTKKCDCEGGYYYHDAIAGRTINKRTDNNEETPESTTSDDAIPLLAHLTIDN